MITKFFIPVFLCLTLILCFNTVSAANGDTIYVNGSHGNDSWDGYTPETAKLTIKNATDTVNNNGTVYIANGHYSGVNNTNIAISKNITVSGESREGTIIDGTYQYRIFEIMGNSLNVTFQNLTFMHGNSSATRGGAIRINAIGDSMNPSSWQKSTATFYDCNFIENTGFNGAAIGNYGDLNLYNCDFINNTGNNGAAIFSGSRFANYHIYTNITNCNFYNNKLTGTMNGGAIFNNDNSEITISNSTFIGNIGNNGGAINNNAVGKMTITGCYFANNTGNWGADVVSYGNKYNECWLVAHNNIFLSEGAHGAVHTGDDSPANITENWWGTNLDPFLTKFGPYNTGKITVGLLNQQGLMNYDPWVILTVNATPNTIKNSGNATVNADLNHLSNGNQLSNPLYTTPITLNIPWGSFTQTEINHNITINTVNGIINAIFYANEGPINPLFNPVRVNASTNSYTTNETESAYITITPYSILTMQITSSNNNPKTGETFTLTYKLGNNGPDEANNVVITIPLPAGFMVDNITGDGTWTYNKNNNSITWTLSNVPVGDPYLYIIGSFNEPGTYTFSLMNSIHTINVQNSPVNPVPEANAASNTIKTIQMQNTGLTIAGLILAILALFGGLATSKRK